jgi:hypothetical protein
MLVNKHGVFLEGFTKVFTMVTNPSRAGGQGVAFKLCSIAACGLAIFAMTYIAFITKAFFNNSEQWGNI